MTEVKEELKKVLQEESDRLEEEVMDMIEVAREKIKDLTPVKTGEMKSTVKDVVDPRAQVTFYAVSVGGENDAEYAHDINYNPESEHYRYIDKVMIEEVKNLLRKVGAVHKDTNKPRFRKHRKTQ